MKKPMTPNPRRIKAAPGKAWAFYDMDTGQLFQINFTKPPKANREDFGVGCVRVLITPIQAKRKK